MEEEKGCETGVKIWCETREGVEGGLIVRKRNGERGSGDTTGLTLMDSVPVGRDSVHVLP